MRLRNLSVGEISTIQLKPMLSSFGSPLEIGNEASLRYNSAWDEYQLFVEDRVWPVVGFTSADQKTMEQVFARGGHAISWISVVSPRRGETTSATLQVHSFQNLYVQPDTLKIAVPDLVVEDIRRRYLQDSTATVDKVIQWLTEHVVLEGNSIQRVIVSSGPNPFSASTNSFRIHGGEINLDVRNMQDKGLEIQRVVRARRSANGPEFRLMILEGKFLFEDATVVEQYRPTAQTLLDAIVAQSNSYLALWGEYNRIEKQNILQKARGLGWLKYQRAERLDDGGWRFYIHPSAEAIETLESYPEEITLAAGSELPRELEEPELNDDAWGNLFERKPSVEGQMITVNPEQGTVVLRPLDPEMDLPKEERGYLYVSLSGDRTRLQRRAEARDAIVRASCPMPQLGLILENRPFPIAPHRRIELKKLKRVIREAFDGHEPTDRQLQAIEIALNTPDIAIIQGPPGTGKTRVIAAIQSCLAALADESQHLAGQTLLTSYQHEAVDNVASVTSVMGLPPIKVGGRQNSPIIGFSDSVASWVDQKVELLEQDIQRFTAPPLRGIYKHISDLHKAYTLNPVSPQQTIALLWQVYDLAKFWLESERLDQIVALVRRLERSAPHNSALDSVESQILVRSIRSLRVTPETFLDDGDKNAYKVLRRLKNELDVDEIQILQKATNWMEGESLDFLPQLADLRDVLLDRYFVALLPTVGVPLVNANVDRLLSSVLDSLELRLKQTVAGHEEVVYEYLQDLKNDPMIEDTMALYSAVLAATVQQSVGMAMTRLKDSKQFEFESVIVDEAARANPLDLMIPLSRARKRIVLVGDHRQLPHVLEPDVERVLDSSEEDTQSQIGQSLFERLFFEHRSSRDGIQRTVSLDQQYRMHPDLGNFVSHTFYEPYGETFQSPRAESEFEHGLQPYAGRVGVWVHFPLSLGREKGRQTKARKVEAEWIASEVKRILDLKTGQSLGVITFYRGQEQLLLQEFMRLGLAEDRGGILQVAAHYRLGKEQLRVGTVDAFQGREFDIVFLSMTRSNSLQAKDLRTARAKYGFLTLENRLCVSMSRQKRLLIVVGDADMLKETTASEHIRGLVQFYKTFGRQDAQF